MAEREIKVQQAINVLRAAYRRGEYKHRYGEGDVDPAVIAPMSDGWLDWIIANHQAA